MDAAEGEKSKESAKHKLLRGGSRDFSLWDCRSACRGHFQPVNAFDGAGFRVVCLP